MMRSSFIIATVALSCCICVIKGAEAPTLATPAQEIALSAAGGSFSPVFSADGRYLFFLSHADNLVTNDDRGSHLDIFVRDLQLNTARLVTLQPDGTGGIDIGANSITVSSNGQLVAFASAATNLVPNGYPYYQNIFITDWETNRSLLASVGPTNGPLWPSVRGARCDNPFLSSDGRWVFYESLAMNVAAGASDLNYHFDIYARDLINGTNALISRSASTNAAANNASRIGILSRNMRFLVFMSTATDLITNGTLDGLDHIYLRDLTAGTNLWLSRYGYISPSPDWSFSPVVGEDGRYVAFKTAVTNQSVASVHLFDTYAVPVTNFPPFNPVTNLSQQSSLDSALALTADSRTVVFDEQGQLYRYDTETKTRSLISKTWNSTNTPADGTSKHPIISENGRWLAFVSSARNLTPNGPNGLFQIYLHDLSTGMNRLITTDLTGRPSTYDHELATFVVRDDGAVAFDSRDENLAAGDSNDASDVFLRDLNGAIALISKRHFDLPAATRDAFHVMGRNSLSSDGQKVVFTQVAQEPRFSHHVLARDLQQQTSTELAPTTNVCGDSLVLAIDASVSASGRYAAYFQRCDPVGPSRLIRQELYTGNSDIVAEFPAGPLNLLTNVAPSFSYDGNRIVYHDFRNVYLKNMLSNSVELVSVRAGGTNGGNGPSVGGQLSPDGRYVLFTSFATDLVVPASGASVQLFLRDLQTKTTRWLSTPQSNYLSAYVSSSAFSANSRHIVFVSSRFGNVYDLQTQERRVICELCEHAAISGDARWAVYSTREYYPPAQVVLRDMQTGTTNLITKSIFDSGGGNANSTSPLITSDSRYIIFVSRATNLVAEITGGEPNIFVHDRIENATWLATAGIPGLPRTHHGSINPVLGPDGHTVVFESFAGNLVPGDYNDERDLFILRLGSGDSDGDSLPDDWEVAYFGDLSRNGTQDFDRDGHSDAQEFTAGTDPTNNNSVFRVFTLTFGAEGTRIFWHAVPGKTYRAEYKDTLQDSWQSLGTVTATSAAASFLDPSFHPTRFYRVVLN
jgi:Tol biopolymer transport system component